jgi:hypothetical protein
LAKERKTEIKSEREKGDKVPKGKRKYEKCVTERRNSSSYYGGKAVVVMNLFHVSVFRLKKFIC